MTGSNGHLGKQLGKALSQRYGLTNVFLTDINDAIEDIEGSYIKLDVTNKKEFTKIVTENKINHILHCSSFHSVACEKNLDLAMKVNIEGLHNALNIARDCGSQIFVPSTIDTFGPVLEKTAISDDSAKVPVTFYGISKLYAENLGNYYYKKFGTDFRSLRYPVIITQNESSINDVTSYPTESLLKALNQETFVMYIEPEINLPMIHISDCIKGTIEFIEVGNSYLSRRVYNLNGLNFTPKEYFKALNRTIKIKVEYEIDTLMNDVAKTWSIVLDDSNARRDWDWKPQIFNLKKLVEKFIHEMFKFQVPI